MRSTSSTCIGIRYGAALPPRDFGVPTDEVRRRYAQHVALVVKRFVPAGRGILRLEINELRVRAQ